MELDDCQWIHCFLLPEGETAYQEQAAEEWHVDEPEEQEEEFLLQELGAIKAGDEKEEEEEEECEKTAPEDSVGEELQEKVDNKQEVSPVRKTDSPSSLPAVSFHRLKYLLSSQLKACLSRVPATASTEASPEPQETNGPSSAGGSLLKCDHCSRYFSPEALAIHLHSVISHTSYHCQLCSRNFSTRAQFSLHVCLSDNRKKKVLTLACSCSICGLKFANNRKLVSHLLTHDPDELPVKPKPEATPKSEDKELKDFFVKEKNQGKDFKLNLKELTPISLPHKDDSDSKPHVKVTRSSEVGPARRGRSAHDGKMGSNQKQLSTKSLPVNSTRLRSSVTKEESARSVTTSSSRRQEVSSPRKCAFKDKVKCKQKSLRSNGHISAVHQCQLCNASFDSVRSLTLHTKKHKALKCHVCPKTFTKTHELTEHVKTHKHSCHLCQGKSFSSEPRLQAHLRTAHSRQTRSCRKVRGK